MLERDEISLTNTNYRFSCAMNSIHMGYLFPITKIGIKDQTKDIILIKLSTLDRLSAVIRWLLIGNNFHDDVVIYVPKGTQETYREDCQLFENVVEIL